MHDGYALLVSDDRYFFSEVGHVATSESLNKTNSGQVWLGAGLVCVGAESGGGCTLQPLQAGFRRARPARPG